MDALQDGGFDAYGLEPSASFRDEAMKRGIEKERLQLATIEDASYDRGTFDLISFSAVLEHFQAPGSALERAMEWLAEEGLIFVEVPSARWLLGGLLNTAYRVQGLDYVTNLSPMHPPYHLYEFTLESFIKHGERVGYAVAEYHFLPCETFLPRPLEKVAQRLMAATDTGMQLQLWLRASDQAGASERRSSASSGAQRPYE